ncbi:MAG: dephospho-CoA kinase [Proteobacteria bacterium]|nr:dephospho-CoA kinase [Pseudomonadota bacterium]
MFNAHSVTGLTGGMGSGKSTVSAMLPALGYAIVDADQLTRTVHRQPEVHEKLRAAFGPDVIDGASINRAILAKYAFASDTARHQLNQIMQPALRQAALQAIRQAKGPVILDAPLLFEAGWDDMTDQNVVVLCPEYIRIQRILMRDNLKMAQILARLRAQLSDSERCIKADYMIYNCADIDDIRRQVLHIFA